MELPDQGLFTVQELAPILNVPVRTLYRKIASGDIPPTQVVRNLGPLRVKRGYVCELFGVPTTWPHPQPGPALDKVAS